ncbi:MAG: hypothetical protein ACTSXP_18755, partial [Promethearchaeota archaeon]
MNLDNLFNIKDIIKQELLICKDLIENECFDDVNIFGNRIMENCLFSDEYRLFIFGLFIKEIAVLNLKIRSSKEPKAVQTVKTICLEFISKLVKALDGDEIDEQKIWTEFHLLRIKINEFLKNKSESMYYQENKRFSDSISINLIKYLSKERDLLYYKKFNNFFKGILNVLERIYRVHSGTLEFTLRFHYIRYLDCLYDYILIEHYTD